MLSFSLAINTHLVDSSECTTKANECVRHSNHALRIGGKVNCISVQKLSHKSRQTNINHVKRKIASIGITVMRYFHHRVTNAMRHKSFDYFGSLFNEFSFSLANLIRRKQDENNISLEINE